jgi:hypothetical protein
MYTMKGFWLTILTIIFMSFSVFWISKADNINIDDLFFSGSLEAALDYSSDVNFHYDWNNFAWKIFLLDSIDNSEIISLSWDTKNCRKQLRWFMWNSARWNKIRPLDSQTLLEFRDIDSSYDNLEIAGWWYANCDWDSTHIYGAITHNRKSIEYVMIAGVTYDFLNNNYNTIFSDNLNSNTNTIDWYYFDSYGWIGDISWAGIPICDTTRVWDRAVVCSTDILIQTNDCGQTQTVNWTKLCWSVNWWWWGGGSTITKDECNWEDCSSSYYDDSCEAEPVDSSKHNSAIEINPDYSIEQNNAYSYAYQNWITTMPTIEKADIKWKLIRKHLAKMITVYAVNVLWLRTDNSMSGCKDFADIKGESNEMKLYMQYSCQLGLMWLDSNGSPATKFNPNEKVTRAQFGTVMSRMLRWTKYNWWEWKRYTKHLEALKDWWIMTKIDTPKMLELRWWVMLMLMRNANS